MNIVCITVGKKHSPAFVAMISDYEKRLNIYVTFNFLYVPTSDKATESQKILAVIKPDDIVMLLDERGQDFNNMQLASYFDDLKMRSVKRIVIVISGAYGVDQSVFRRATTTVALSKLVFPHQLVRLIVVEQLYRSFNLLAGGKYHHD